jgi:hypothetical protein
VSPCAAVAAATTPNLPPPSPSPLHPLPGSEYLRLSNRPFSAINIFDNLHGAVGKATLPRLLDSLSEEGTICGKLFGKFKV